MEQSGGSSPPNNTKNDPCWKYEDIEMLRLVLDVRLM
ncbi:hypothetical protein OROHE_024454 [Orobanche hederae]